MDTPPILPGETPEQVDIRLNKDVAAFAYVWVMSVVVLVSRRESKFAQFHAKQGLVLFLLSLPVWLIPVIGQFLTIILVAGMVLGFMNAAQGKYADVPIAGPLSRGEMSGHDLIEMFKHFFREVTKLFKGVSKKEETATPKQSKPPTPPPTSPPENKTPS